MLIDFITDILLPLILVVIVFVGFILFPLSWLDGHAKSAYIKQTQNIEIPWYQATWLEVDINNVNGTLEISK